MRKAIIENGKVINIIEVAGDTPIGFNLPLSQQLYSCDNYAVAIGDDFCDGVFSRDGEPVEPIINPFKRELDELREVMSALVLSQMALCSSDDVFAVAANKGLITEEQINKATGIKIPSKTI